MKKERIAKLLKQVESTVFDSIELISESERLTAMELAEQMAKELMEMLLIFFKTGGEGLGKYERAIEQAEALRESVTALKRDLTTKSGGDFFAKNPESAARFQEKAQEGKSKGWDRGPGIS